MLWRPRSPWAMPAACRVATSRQAAARVASPTSAGLASSSERPEIIRWTSSPDPLPYGPASHTPRGRLAPAAHERAPDPVQEVLVAPLPGDELGEQPLAVGGDGLEPGRAAGVAPTHGDHLDHREAPLGQGLGGPFGRRPAPGGAEQKV